MDIVVERVIHRPRDEVSAYASEPANPPDWYANIDSATTYAWDDVAGGTRMTLRNRGGAGGLARMLDPIAGIAARRATRKDLRRLAEILEA